MNRAGQGTAPVVHADLVVLVLWSHSFVQFGRSCVGVPCAPNQVLDPLGRAIHGPDHWEVLEEVWVLGSQCDPVHRDIVKHTA